MPGITEATPPQHLQHHPPQALASPSTSPSLPGLETTSNVVPDNGPSEPSSELTSTYHLPSADHKSPQPNAPLPNPQDPPVLSAAQSRARTIQARNRRFHYLTTHHATYFSNPTLELADPLLYDKCIRSFQTASEREAEGKAKGWSGILHADLERAEARMEALRKATEDRRNGKEEDEDDKVGGKEEGIERWQDAMTRRFIGGGDEDIDYKMIDDNEEYDDVKQIERDVQEAYFDAETPSAPDDGSSCTDTGIQDY